MIRCAIALLILLIKCCREIVGIFLTFLTRNIKYNETVLSVDFYGCCIQSASFQLYSSLITESLEV